MTTPLRIPACRHTLRDGRSVLIRAATASDAQACVALVRSVAQDRGYTLYEPDEVDEWAPKIARRIRESADDTMSIRLIALPYPGSAGGPEEVLGDLTISGDKRRRIMHTATLGMEVRRDYRGVGLGDTLMRTGLAWAASHPHIERVDLYVLAENAPAIALYKKHGFLEEGRRKRLFRLGPGRYVDDITMAKCVKP